MLYLLLYPLSDRFAAFNVLRYPSFRMIMAGLVSLLVGLLLGPTYIEAMRQRRAALQAGSIPLHHLHSGPAHTRASASSAGTLSP